MIRIKDGQPKECCGKYLTNFTNIGLQIIVANQDHKTKKEFIDHFLDEVKKYLNDITEEI